MIRRIPIAAFTFLVAACSGNPAPAGGPAGGAGSPAQAASKPAPADPAAAAAATITPEDMYRRISFLASDELLGRDTPSPGLEKAATYIAGEFRSFGLTPEGDDGTFLQRWSYARTTLDRTATSITLSAGKFSEEARAGRDFFVLPAMGADSASAPLVYAGMAVAGRPALGKTAAGAFAAFYVPGTEMNSEWQAAIQNTAMAAIPAGVKGVLLILDPAFEKGMISQIADELVSQAAPIFLIGIDYASAQRVFSAAGIDLDARRAVSDTTVTVAKGARLGIRVKLTSDETHPPNVVGMLAGSDPALRDEYVVFSAHMDHVGVGAPDATGDSIFNGADDDASGTATMLEVAQAFASMPKRPARSLLFLAVSGEEKGLLGSKHFTSNPPVPVDRIVADINLDMVGRNNPDSVVAIGNEYSSLGGLVQEVAHAHPELGLTVAPDLWPEERLFFRSDHFNFAKAGVPAIFFTTGLHDQYHKQSDEVDLIDLDKISRVGRLVFHLAWQVATRPTAPTWTQLGLDEVQPAGHGR